ncbi:MAG: DUF4445 domain-containing protein [Verrucomicrobia bacterium]|jgi:uncharacterized 2Fe-2S/4Fe-4S cluster protein (DUF4445 family)|nr:DUF4445 domain-containing protein [Verrucomicrobiota bacterium]MBT7700602.1 DUF4445 domain-containing protein [Verrucomicrobiota bacterium]
MKTYTATFLPENKTVTAVKGKSLLEAAAVAGIRINSICAGDGVCGKCRVLVKSGKVTAKPNMFLTRREIQRGMALACQTYVAGDVIVEVPLESRSGAAPILAPEDALRYGRESEWIDDEARFRRQPLSRKLFVELPPPTLDDALCDQERLFRELRKHQDIPVMQMGLTILKQLPAVLRDSDWKITVLLGRRGDTLEVVDIEAGDTTGSHFGLAVDLGTTTLVAQLVDLCNGATVSTQAKYNSQAACGEDVIARMMCANDPARREELKQMVVDDINDLLNALLLDSGAKAHDVTYVMCAGNTVMTHLLLGLDPANIRRDPYIPSVSEPPVIRASEIGLGINPRGLLAVLPCIASYVGGDVVAGVFFSGMASSDDVSLLIDMGTNGEVVLGNREWQVCCSASAGPSFEGGGITCGMRATNGAVERMDLESGGRVTRCDVVGGGKPLGLCGSGLIDLVGELQRVGCIDRKGRFVHNACGDRLRKDETGALEFVLFSTDETVLGREITLSEADIRNLIHSKGSIYMACECLLTYVDMTFSDLAHIYVAGGFGSYLEVPKAIRLGLLPDVDHERFQFIGNASLQGARMALLSQDALAFIREKIGASMTYLDLSSSPQYMNEYSSCLFLPHTDLERFPSVTQASAPALATTG